MPTAASNSNSSAPATRTWMTAADVAIAVRAEVQRGDSSFALRMLRFGLADLRRLESAADRATFLAEPPTTGDERWDALLAAAIGRECRLAGIATPRWTRVAPLRSWWFPNGDTIRQARTMQLTPIDLANKGIWLDARALDAA